MENGWVIGREHLEGVCVVGGGIGKGKCGQPATEKSCKVKTECSLDSVRRRQRQPKRMTSQWDGGGTSPITQVEALEPTLRSLHVCYDRGRWIIPGT